MKFSLRVSRFRSGILVVIVSNITKPLMSFVLLKEKLENIVGCFLKLLICLNCSD